MNGKFFLKGGPSGATLDATECQKKKKKTNILYENTTIS